VFCNQTRITGSTTDVTPDDVTKIISEYLTTLPKTDRVIEAAFFGGSFTGIPIDEQSALLEAAHSFLEKGLIDGIRLSTRPDYISTEILDNLLKYGVTTIELGVQSMNDGVLKASNRGHTKADVIKAVELIKKYPFTLGLQMMTGLPTDTDEKALQTADEIIKLKPDIVRIYPTLTIKDTYLEKLYKTGKYIPQTLEEAVNLSKQLMLKFEANDIRVIRVGLQSTDEISENGSVVAGPVHSSFRELVESSIFYDKIAELIADEIQIGTLKNGDTKTVLVHPRDISKAIGNKKSNINKIKENFGINLKIVQDENVSRNEVEAFVFKKT
jgi:histone acetyltransferase (RNA polymerase elongator complex component)